MTSYVPGEVMYARPGSHVRLIMSFEFDHSPLCECQIAFEDSEGVRSFGVITSTDVMRWDGAGRLPFNWCELCKTEHSSPFCQWVDRNPQFFTPRAVPFAEELR